MNSKFVQIPVFTAIIVLLLQGCLPTGLSIVSYKDPDFAYKVYNKICVNANTYDLHQRTVMEVSAVNLLRENGIESWKSAELMPPTREWNAENTFELLNQKGFDAFLVIEIENVHKETVFVPGKTVVETKKTSAHDRDKDSTKSSRKSERVETTTVTDEPARTYEYLMCTVTAKIFDVKTGKTAWVSSIKDVGGRDINTANLNNANFINNLTEEIFNGLLKDGIIRKKIS